MELPVHGPHSGLLLPFHAQLSLMLSTTPHGSSGGSQDSKLRLELKSSAQVQSRVAGKVGRM